MSTVQDRVEDRLDGHDQEIRDIMLAVKELNTRIAVWSKVASFFIGTNVLALVGTLTLLYKLAGALSKIQP